MGALDHLHQLHHQSGVEVVQVHQPLGVLGDPGQLGADQVGAVGGQNGVRLDDFADPPKEFLLNLQVLDDGLHHQVGVLHASIHVSGEGEAGGHGVSLLLGDAALVHPALQVVGSPGPGAVHRLLKGVGEDHLIPLLPPVEGGVHGDLAAHGPGTDHRYTLDVFNFHKNTFFMAL